jgi:hypothetical protein
VTFVAGDTGHLAVHNTINDPWTTYVPTWTGLTVGNGIVLARKLQVGKTVDFYVKLIFGSTSGVTSVVTVSAPVAALAGADYVHDALYIDSAAGVQFGHAQHSLSTITLYAPATTAAGYDRQVAVGVPYAWSTSDWLIVQGRYEAA